MPRTLSRGRLARHQCRLVRGVHGSCISGAGGPSLPDREPGARRLLQPPGGVTMALFTQQARKDEPLTRPDVRAEAAVEPEPHPTPAPVQPVTPVPLRSVERHAPSIPTGKVSESVVAAGLTIEGKIEGTGNVRVAGRFKGNVSVKGEVTIEPGASIDGEVKAETVFVGGEVRGQIVSS